MQYNFIRYELHFTINCEVLRKYSLNIKYASDYGNESIILLQIKNLFISYLMDCNPKPNPNTSASHLIPRHK